MLPETLSVFVGPMAAMARRQFPLTCPGCRRRYDDFAEFIKSTVPVGATLGYPLDSLGMISWVRCSCGSSLTVRCGDAAGEDHRRFVAALNAEARALGRTTESLMADMRDAVRLRELGG